MSTTATQMSQPFTAGMQVMVDDRDAQGHCRSPWYLRGKVGVIAHTQGAFHDPELLAYHKPGLPKAVLYKVRFRQRDLWPDYAGDVTDCLEADIYDYWLIPA